MVPKESGFNQSKKSCALRARTLGRFQARLPWQGIMKFYKGSIFVITETHFAIQSQVTYQPNYTERIRVDATIMRSFLTELFSSFLPSAYTVNVNLAATKP